MFYIYLKDPSWTLSLIKPVSQFLWRIYVRVITILCQVKTCHFDRTAILCQVKTRRFDRTTVLCQAKTKTWVPGIWNAVVVMYLNQSNNVVSGIFMLPFYRSSDKEVTTCSRKFWVSKIKKFVCLLRKILGLKAMNNFQKFKVLLGRGDSFFKVKSTCMEVQDYTKCI